MRKTCGKVKLIHISNRNRCGFFCLLSCDKLLRKRLTTLTGIRKFLGTGNSYRNNIVRIKLVPDIKGFKSTFVTTAYQHSKSILRILPSKMNQQFIKGITCISRLFPVSYNQVVKIIFIYKKIRADMAVFFAKAQKSLYLS